MLHRLLLHLSSCFYFPFFTHSGVCDDHDDQTCFFSGTWRPVSYGGPCNADTIKLRIVETTDIHTNLMDYDYYKDKASDQIGLTRAATLVKQARAEVENSVLVDNGDLIQGSPMGDYMAAKGIKLAKCTPFIKP